MHQIGSGVLGPVYRARLADSDPSDHDRVFALKAFHVDLTPEQTIIFGDALQEIVDVGVSHAAVVSPVGTGVADGVPYLACQYVAAESLDVRMRPRAALAAEVALPCIVQLAEALDAAHGRGLAHGALHLRDLLVTSDLTRVSGFGIVAALGRVGQRGPLRRPYAAPEQIAGGDWGPAADRFALAAVAYELLTGRRAGAAGSRMRGYLEQALEADAAARLMRLFEAALAADPEGRPKSARRFADDLAGAAGWTGAAGVRRALAGMGGGAMQEAGGGQDPERVDADPAIAAGGAAPLGGEAVAAAVGGTVMRKRKKRAPWRRKQTEIDWTKRALDLSAPDERPRTHEGDPPAGADDAPDAADSGVDPLDAPLDTGIAGGGARRDPRDGLKLRTGGDALAAVAEGLDAGLRDGRGGAVAGVDPEESGLDPDTEHDVVDGYAPISVGELESRVAADGDPVPDAEPGGGSGAEPDYGSGDALPEARGENDVEPAPRGLDAGASEADEAGDGDIDAPGDDGAFALTSEEAEEGYDYGLEDDAEPEDPAGDIFDRRSIDQARRLPVTLVAVIGVAVAATAFVIGLGWMGGGDDAAPAVEEAAETAAAADAGSAFSEAVVDETPTEPAAVEPGTDAPEAASPAAGGSPAAAAPPDSAPAGSAPVVRQPAPAAVREPDPPPPAVIPEEAAPAPSDGRLLVRSMPPGAEVVVNGESRGTTPLALANLPHGPYDVEVTLAGYGTRSVQLTLDANDPIGRFNPDLTSQPAAPSTDGAVPAGPPPAAEVGIGSIFAESRPSGAAVWLDQRQVGETPALIRNVPAGAHQIEFRRDGYRTWTTTVEVVPATQARVAASLDEAAP